MVKLVSFGLGGILIKEENGWDMIRKRYKIPNLWEKYMDGLLTRNEAKVGEYIIWKLRSVTKNKLKKDLKRFTLMRGAKRTITALKKKGITPVIISDNPEFLVKAVAKRLGIRYFACDRIIFDKKGYAYDTKPTHASNDRRVSKVIAIKDFAKRKKIPLKECAAIGNSSSDIDLFKKVGFSIALNATDAQVKKAANKYVRTKDLTKVLKYLN